MIVHETREVEAINGRPRGRPRAIQRTRRELGFRRDQSDPKLLGCEIVQSQNGFESGDATAHDDDPAGFDAIR